MTSARLPTAKELADFDFAASPVNEPLIRELATGGFLEGQRNVVLVGGCAAGHRVSRRVGLLVKHFGIGASVEDGGAAVGRDLEWNSEIAQKSEHRLVGRRRSVTA